MKTYDIFFFALMGLVASLRRSFSFLFSTNYIPSFIHFQSHKFSWSCVSMLRDDEKKNRKRFFFTFLLPFLYSQ